MLQEGKNFNGLGFQRGDSPVRIFNEISLQGAGMKKYYTSYEGFLLKTVGYTTARVSAFLYFYDWVNKDPRRYAKPEKLLYAAVPAGLIAGIVTNPLEIVFARMQVEDLGYRRNYTSFYDGFVKTCQEGAIFRGAIANGLRISMLLGTMTGLADWMKENSYYFLGPSNINRALGTIFGATVGSIASMPFDTIRMRLYAQQALPNGKMPYAHALDVFNKIATYESNHKHHASFNSLYNGFLAYFGRYIAIFLVSQYLLDWYQSGHFQPEQWTSARYSFPTGIDFDIHDPYTMTYHKAVVHQSTDGSEETKMYNPDGKPLRYS